MYVVTRFVVNRFKKVVGGKMTIDAIEQITNIIHNIGILLIYIFLACMAWKTYKWTSEWSKKIRHGSPVEGRCYYSFKQGEKIIVNSLPCSIIPDIDIDIETKTVTRAKVFRESHTQFNTGQDYRDSIKKWGDSIWIFHNMPNRQSGWQGEHIFLSWEEVTHFEVWYENKWQELKPYQGEVEKS